MKTRSTLDAKTRYELTKMVEHFSKTTRRETLTSTEFRTEASKNLGVPFSQGNIEGAVESLGLKMSDIFKPDPRQGVSPFAQLYKLEKRVAELERKLEKLG